MGQDGDWVERESQNNNTSQLHRTPVPSLITNASFDRYKGEWQLRAPVTVKLQG